MTTGYVNGGIELEDKEVSEEVGRFLAAHISSVAQLETLLLLQMNPGRKWSAEELAHELRIESVGAEKQLGMLVRSGLLRKDEEGRFGYAPANAELHRAVVALAQSYLVRRVTIIAMIFANPSENLRAFSDAFRLRKDSDASDRG